MMNFLRLMLLSPRYDLLRIYVPRGVAPFRDSHVRPRYAQGHPGLDVLALLLLEILSFCDHFLYRSIQCLIEASTAPIVGGLPTQSRQQLMTVSRSKIICCTTSLLFPQNAHIRLILQSLPLSCTLAERTSLPWTCLSMFFSGDIPLWLSWRLP